MLKIDTVKKEDIKIVFYGSPDFAVASLKCIFEAGYKIEAVVTAPDKPAGRGQKLSESAVKKFALQKGLRVLQPEKLKSHLFTEILQEINPDLQIVIAFRMLPESVWSYPRLGTFNLHASLLPDYRGAAPINHAIINGESHTGVTTFFLKHEIDTGDIILSKKVDIDREDTAGALHDKLMHIGSEAVLETLEHIVNETLVLTPQKEASGSKVAPKIFKDFCEIKWNNTAEDIRNHVRGLNPVPGAFTRFKNGILKVFKVEATDKKTLEAGDARIEKDAFLFGTADLDVALLEVQPEGKRRMGVAEFLRGLR